MKAAKQRMLEDANPNRDDVLKVQLSVAQRFQKDEQLNFVFDRLQEIELYVNPKSPLVLPNGSKK